jgi:hypothetical protein
MIQNIDDYVPKLLDLLKDPDVEWPIKIWAIASLGDTLGTGNNRLDRYI